MLVASIVACLAYIACIAPTYLHVCSNGQCRQAPGAQQQTFNHRRSRGFHYSIICIQADPVPSSLVCPPVGLFLPGPGLVTRRYQGGVYCSGQSGTRSGYAPSLAPFRMASRCPGDKEESILFIFITQSVSNRNRQTCSRPDLPWRLRLQGLLSPSSK